MKMDIETMISAPPGEVYDTFTDLEAGPERIGGIDAVEVMTDGPIGVGTRWTETRTMFGRSCTEEFEVTRADRPGVFAGKSESCGMLYEWAMEFEPAGGQTRVRLTMDTTARTLVARVTGPIFGIFLKGAMRKAMEQDLADAKAYLEAR